MSFGFILRHSAQRVIIIIMFYTHFLRIKMKSLDQCTSFRKLYRTAVAKLMKEHFTEEKLFERIDTFEKAITHHIKKDEIGKGLSGMQMGINGDSNGKS